MINFDEMPKYKAQRSFLNYIIYMEFEDGKGTWSVWDTIPYDGSEIDARLLYGDEERGFMVRNDLTINPLSSSCLLYTSDAADE